MNYGILISEFIAIVLGAITISITIFSRGRKLSFKILSIYLLILTALVIQAFIFDSRIIYQVPHLFRVISPFRLLLGPLFYLFLRTLYLKEKNLHKSEWLHIIPFVIHYIVLIPFLISSNAVKLSIIKQFEETYILNLPSYNITLFNPDVFEKLTLLSYLIYTIFIIRLYRKYRNQQQQIFDINKSMFKLAELLTVITSIGSLVLVLLPIIIPDLAQLFLLKLIVLLVLSVCSILLILNPDLLYGSTQSLEIKNNRSNLLSQISFEEANLLAMSTTSYESNLFLDLNYRVLFFNSLAKIEFKNIFNQELKIGMNFREFIFPEYTSKFQSAFAKAVNGSINEYYALSNINQEEKEWHVINFTPIYDARQLLIGISITSQNINEEIKAQNKTRQYIKNLEDIAWKEVHLLNAPISNLLGITKFLLKPESDISLEEQDVLINHISIEVEKLDIVIHEIINRVNETVKHA